MNFDRPTILPLLTLGMVGGVILAGVGWVTAASPRDSQIDSVGVALLAEMPSSRPPNRSSVIDDDATLDTARPDLPTLSEGSQARGPDPNTTVSNTTVSNTTVSTTTTTATAVKSSVQPGVTPPDKKEPVTSGGGGGKTKPDVQPVGKTGRVVWLEDFDRLDLTRWTLEHSTYGDGNNELQCYRPENVSVRDGRLVLKAVHETYTCPNGSRRQHTSGMIRSRGVTFSPGQGLEFRVKLNPANPDTQSGLWPAVWASSWAPGGWPLGGELDFLEVMTANNPKRSIYSIHFAKPDGSHGVLNQPVIADHNFSADWHTIRFDYGRGGHLVWYLDGEKVFEVKSAKTKQGYPAPFDQAIRELKINLALGGRPGPLDRGALGSRGATFEVDYIKVFEL